MILIANSKEEITREAYQQGREDMANEVIELARKFQNLSETTVHACALFQRFIEMTEDIRDENDDE